VISATSFGSTQRTRERKLCRSAASDLVAFIHRAFRDLNPQALFMPAPYIELMVSRLEDCRSGKSRRLIINPPPRSLNSHCVSTIASRCDSDPR
jgi:hypothetical protein